MSRACILYLLCLSGLNFVTASGADVPARAKDRVTGTLDRARDALGGTMEQARDTVSGTSQRMQDAAPEPGQVADHGMA